MTTDVFKREAENNEEMFKRLCKQARPDVFALMELLDLTGINWFVIAKIIRQLNNVNLGTGYGKISVILENHIVKFVNGEELDKLNEKLVTREPINPYAA